MIHFDFTVEDEDADTIFRALHQEIVDCYQGIAELFAEGVCTSPAKKVWYEDRIAYLEGLKGKMTNSRVS